MGIRSTLRQKLEKHGGPVGLAVAVVTKPVRLLMPQDAENTRRNATPVRIMPRDPDAEGFRAVAAADAVTDGKPGTYAVGDRAVSVFRLGSTLYAIDDACTHEDGPLGEGTLDGKVVTCPYHDWRFDVTTGECLTQADRHVACFAVRERDGWIWVGKKTREGATGRGGEHDDGLVTPTFQV